MTPLSQEKKLALNAIRDEHLVDQGYWIFYLINMIVEHPNALDLAHALITLNRVFLNQIHFCKPSGSEGSYFKKIFLRFMKSEHPMQVIDSILEGDREVALHHAQADGLIRPGPVSPIMIAVLLEHAQPREMCCALKLLNEWYGRRLTLLGPKTPPGRFIKGVLSKLYRSEHPVITMVALQMTMRLFRHQYTFTLDQPDEGLLAFHIYFSRGHDGFLNYSMLNQKDIIHQKLPFQIPENMSLESLDERRDEIMRLLHMRGHIEYYIGEWHHFFIKELLNHSMPYTLSLMLSKFNDTDFWEDTPKIKLLTFLSKYSLQLLTHPEFFQLFMQLPVEVMTDEFIENMVEILKRLHQQLPSFLQLILVENICKKIKSLLGVHLEELPQGCQPAPYINLLIQKEEFIRRFPQAQSALFDFNQFNLEDYFESPKKCGPS